MRKSLSIIVLILFASIAVSAAGPHEVTVEPVDQSGSPVTANSICMISSEFSNCVEDVSKTTFLVPEGTFDISIDADNFKNVNDDDYIWRDQTKTYYLDPSTDTYSIEDYGPSGDQENNDVELFVELDREPPVGSGVECRFEEGGSISYSDSKRMYKDGNRWSRERVNLNPGNYRFTFDCYQDGSSVVDRSRTTSFTIEEDEPGEGTLEITVEDRGGDEMEDAEVDVLNDGEKDTDSNGEASFTLEPGEYDVEVTCGDFDERKNNIEVEAGETTEETIEFDRYFDSDDCDDVDEDDEEASISVTVWDNEDDRLENALVSIENGDEDSDRTDNRGETFFYNLEPDRYDITVTCEGEEETESVRLSEGDEDEIDIEMDFDSSDNECDDEEESQTEAFFTVSDSTPRIGQSVLFDASDSEGDILEYRWSFPDYTTDYGETTYYSFESAGRKTVRLRVTDENGDQDTYSRTLNVERRDDGNDDDEDRDGSLTVTVEDDENDELEDAYVRVRNGDYETGYTDSDGEIEFDNLEPDTYDIRVECEDETETDSIRVDEGENEDITIEMDFDSNDNECDDDRDDEDPRARLDINPSIADFGEEIEFDATDSYDDGDIEEYEFDLDGDGDWDVENDDGTVERAFFREFDGEARVRVTDDDGNRDTVEEVYDVRSRGRVSIRNVRYPDQVCSGESFDVTVDVENLADRERFVILDGRGFGDTRTRTVELDEDEERKITFTFTPQSPGSRSFTISSSNSNVVRRTIAVLDCERQPDEETTGLSISVMPERIRAGESVKISGYADGRGRQSVRILINGRMVSDTSTQPDGYFQVYAYPEQAGNNRITVSSNGITRTANVEVLPTVSVASMKTEESIFQGESFQICGNVESQVAPLVVLMRNGERVDSNYGSGEVCFDVVNHNAGETRYTLQAFARGETGALSREVEVLETRPEVTSFPEKIASVESEEGIIKTTIYNNHQEQRRYDVHISGLPDGWTSTSEKQIVLQPGEENEVFFYLTPQQEGTYYADIKIDNQGSTIYRDSVEVITGGTTQPQRRSFFERLVGAFNWR